LQRSLSVQKNYHYSMKNFWPLICPRLDRKRRKFGNALKRSGDEKARQTRTEKVKSRYARRERQTKEFV